MFSSFAHIFPFFPEFLDWLEEHFCFLQRLKLNQNPQIEPGYLTFGLDVQL